VESAGVALPAGITGTTVTFTSIGTSTLTGTSTSTGPRLIAPDTAAATGPDTAAAIAQVAVVIDTEAVGITAEAIAVEDTAAVIVAGGAAAGIANRPGHGPSRADSVS
jgi:hypothetical protein